MAPLLTPCILAELAKFKPRRVLDLGAGNGALCLQIAAAGYDVVGVEVDEQGVAIARQAYPGLRFHQGGIDDDPSKLLAEEEAFDVVVSTEVVEHLYAPHHLPQYAAQVLRPGGWLIVSTPYHGYWKNLALSLANAWDKHHTPLWHGGHIKFWSRKTLTNLLESNDFRVVSFTGVGRFPYLWMSMVLVAQLRR